ncbi:heme exporter protein CcmD [Novosphingopyxis iocasae]|nr:heme exporter protein CcmD [Novosphingopyxis iocasae]
MTQWTYVILAYGAVLVGMAGLVVASYGAMRRAERSAEALKRK